MVQTRRQAASPPAALDKRRNRRFLKEVRIPAPTKPRSAPVRKTRADSLISDTSNKDAPTLPRSTPVYKTVDSLISDTINKNAPFQLAAVNKIFFAARPFTQQELHYAQRLHQDFEIFNTLKYRIEDCIINIRDPDWLGLQYAPAFSVEVLYQVLAELNATAAEFSREEPETLGEYDAFQHAMRSGMRKLGGQREWDGGEEDSATDLEEEKEGITEMSLAVCAFVDQVLWRIYEPQGDEDLDW